MHLYLSLFLININEMLIFSELITKYNDKARECEGLRQVVDKTNKEIKDITYNYNSTLAKIIKLELVSKRIYVNIKYLSCKILPFFLLVMHY